MFEFGTINITDILIAVLAFFLVDLVRQIKTLNIALASLKETLSVEIAIRNEIRLDVDRAHERIREMQSEISDIRVSAARCKSTGINSGE